MGRKGRDGVWRYGIMSLVRSATHGPFGPMEKCGQEDAYVRAQRIFLSALFRTALRLREDYTTGEDIIGTIGGECFRNYT